MLFSSVIYYYIKVHFHFYIPRKSYTQYVIFYTHNVFILIPKTVLYPGPMFYIPKKNISPMEDILRLAMCIQYPLIKIATRLPASHLTFAAGYRHGRCGRVPGTREGVR